MIHQGLKPGWKIVKFGEVVKNANLKDKTPGEFRKSVCGYQSQIQYPQGRLWLAEYPQALLRSMF